VERIFLHHYDYELSNLNPPLLPTPELMASFATVLRGEPSELLNSVVWNAGFYLWHCGAVGDIKTGMLQAQDLLISGAVSQQSAKIRSLVSPS
jgi:anthranilate phosphoribosyltransferase